jgi:hypothetical protein
MCGYYGTYGLYDLGKLDQKRSDKNQICNKGGIKERV